MLGNVHSRNAGHACESVKPKAERARLPFVLHYIASFQLFDEVK